MNGRICIFCRKPKGVIYHAWEIEGQMRSIPTHLKCLLRERKRKRQTLTAKLLNVFRENH